jgi:hypothetical protein
MRPHGKDRHYQTLVQGCTAEEAMHDDLTNNQGDLQRQERIFVWQLIGFTVLIGIGGLLFVVMAGPKIAKDRRNAELNRFNPGNKHDDETVQRAAQLVAIHQDLARFAQAGRDIDKEASIVMARIDERRMHDQPVADLLGQLKELEGRHNDNRKQIDDLTADIQRIPPDQRQDLETWQEVLRQNRAASMRKLRAALADYDDRSKRP